MKNPEATQAKTGQETPTLTFTLHAAIAVEFARLAEYSGLSLTDALMRCIQAEAFMHNVRATGGKIYAMAPNGVLSPVTLAGALGQRPESSKAVSGEKGAPTPKPGTSIAEEFDRVVSAGEPTTIERKLSAISAKMA